MMKKAHILHNPTAGSQEKSKKDLLSLLSRHGFECGYSSTKKISWKKFDEDPDFLVVAGGDGTVRKVAVNLLQKDRFRKDIPILLLPLGTANNVAKSLGINNNDIENLEAVLESGKRKRYDVGRVSGLEKGAIFLESIGFGIFPELMKKMKETPERKDATPEENIETALEVLHHIITTIPAQPYTVKIDDVTHSENYLLVEVMNTPSFGPNLNLSRDSDPGDGLFELVMIPEKQREEFASYVSYKISGTEKTFEPALFRGKSISIFGGPGPVHVDDELLELKKTKKIRIRTEPGMMDFFVQ
jgi:diacylglycerol kinase family enzyme